MKRWLLALVLLMGTMFGNAWSQGFYPLNSAIIGGGPGTQGFITLGPCADGQVIAWLASVASCTTPPGTGTVISVGLGLPASTFSVSGSPVTSSGTLTGTFINQNPNVVFAGPVGLIGTPTWRALVGADLPPPGIGVLGGVQAVNPIASNWINSINTAGVPQLSQPAFTNISGTLAPTQCPNPTVSTGGCVQAINPVTSNWIRSISVGGVPSLSQPSFNDLSGSLGVGQIASLPAFSLPANATGSPAVPTAVSLTAFIDAAFGSVQGDILYRGASAWTVLAPGASGQVLSSGGAAANPSWISTGGVGTMTSITAGTSITLTPSSCTSSCSVGLTTVGAGQVLSNITGGTAAPIGNSLSATIDAAIGSTQGNVLYRGGSTWAVLAPGTSGQFLMTQGAAANPKWAGGAPTTSLVTLTSHSGGFGANVSGTYTTPANVLWIEIVLVGGGTGGSGAGNVAGGAGGATCWNTSGAACTAPVYQASGGSGSGGGGVAGSSICNVGLSGNGGGGGVASTSVQVGTGGVGGGSASGGGGGYGAFGATGGAGGNYGGGGGGGAANSGAINASGSGGGGGGSCRVIISSPAATYTYVVGAGGTAGNGTGFGFNGGAGGGGVIFVFEHYGS